MMKIQTKIVWFEDFKGFLNIQKCVPVSMCAFVLSWLFFLFGCYSIFQDLCFYLFYFIP